MKTSLSQAAQPTVSIIVPVYNVEKYLRQCLDSILAQTLTDIEIICVDDGSTDASLEILHEYAAKDSRIWVINQENHGYGYALNRGLEVAEGTWLGIIESDDWVDPDAFQTLVNAAVAADAPIAKANFWLDWTEKDPRSQLFEYFSKEEDEKVVNPKTYMDGEIFRRKPSIWSAIYSMEVVKNNKIDFLETPGASFQDTSFTFKVFALAQKMVCLHRAFVHYRQDNESSSINSKGKAYAVCDEYTEISAFVEEMKTVHPEFKDIMIPGVYDTFIWNYERLDQTLKYPFLLIASEWFAKILKERKNLDGLFSLTPWKVTAFESIVTNPMGYHTWREDEKAATNGVKSALHPVPDGFTPHAASVSPFFSIVVPVYNVEKYLRGCLESLVNQTFEDIEIICVNDGSRDLSPKILAEYEERDRRIRIITQPNGGLAAARNAGLDAAQGEYILFVDSDDWLSVDACETLSGRLENRPSETVIFGTEPYPGVPTVPDWLFSVLPVEDEYMETLTLGDVMEMKCLQTFSWRHCFKRKFLNDNNIRFDKNLRFGEDLEFGLIAFPKVTKGAIFISDNLYHYRHWRPDSLMQKAQVSRTAFLTSQFDLVKAACSIIQKQRYKPDSIEFGYLLDQIYGALVTCPEPHRTIITNKFVKLVRKAGLSGQSAGLTKPQARFWRELNRDRYGRRILKNLRNSVRKSVKRRLQHIFLPSRAQMARISLDLNTRLDRQAAALEQLNSILTEMQKARSDEILS